MTVIRRSAERYTMNEWMKHCPKKEELNGEMPTLTRIEKAILMFGTTEENQAHLLATQEVENKLKKDFEIIMWDFITYDFDRRVKPAEILNEIKKRSRSGSVVVFHDSEKAHSNVLATLPDALKFWKENGYEVKAI